MKKLNQPFHLVTFSPWPILVSFSLYILIVNFINFLYNYNYFITLYGFFLLILSLFQWWRDVVRESLYQGFHTKVVVNGLKLGMLLFIISEIFFFIRIFWCYFHMFLSPSIEIGRIWPPNNIYIFNPFGVPLLNTVILLSSGVFVTWCHYSLLNNLKFDRVLRIGFTILLGLIFTFFQFIEYLECSFTISDSVFGSIFFISTGFHGLHVIVGTIFLVINFFRIVLDNFSSIHHFGFEAAVWYWHFVDVVWLFLYLLVYYWCF